MTVRLAASWQGLAGGLDRLLTHLAGYAFWPFVLTLYTASLLGKIAIMLLISETAAAAGQPLVNYQGDAQRSLGQLFLMGVLLAPLLETWLFQLLPIWLLGKFTHRPLWPVLFSALIFGLLHYHRLLVGVIHGLLLGLVFAAAYWYRAQTPGGRPYLAIVSVHALHNLLSWSVQWAQRSGMIGQV